LLFPEFLRSSMYLTSYSSNN